MTALIVQWLMSHSRPLNWGKRTNAYVERAARMGIHLSLVCSHMRAFLGCVTTVADTHPYCLGSRTKSLLPQMFVNAVGRSDMALIKCPECGNQVSDKASMCPKCGCPLDCCVETDSVSQVEGQNQPPTFEPSADDPASADEAEDKGSDSNGKRERKIQPILIAVGLYLAVTVGFFALAVFGQMVARSDFLVNMGVGATGLLIIGSIPYLIATLVFHLVLKEEHQERIISAVRGKAARFAGVFLMVAFLGVSYLIGGSPLACSHDNAPSPTCTDASVCPDCGITLAGALGHDPGNWTDWQTDYEDAKYVKERICKRCDEVVDSKDKPMESFVADGRIAIHPAGFAKRFEETSGGINGYSFNLKQETDDGKMFYDETNTLFYRIENEKEDYKSIGMCQFNAPDGSLLALKDDYTTSSMSGVSILIEDAWDASAIVVATVMALNPGLGYNEAFDLAEDIVENVGNMDGLSSNSLKYVFYKDQGYPGYHYLLVSAV